MRLFGYELEEWYDIFKISIATSVQQKTEATQEVVLLKARELRFCAAVIYQL
jgi:hypothetical protein